MCDGFGSPQYLTFDRSNYTFNGNCTYIAARDVNPHGKHTFQVGFYLFCSYSHCVNSCNSFFHISWLYNYRLTKIRNCILFTEVFVSASGAFSCVLETFIWRLKLLGKLFSSVVVVWSHPLELLYKWY